MKRYVLLLLALVVALALIGSAFAQDGTAAEKKAPAFVGAKKCMMCHKGPGKGNVAEIWMASKHAKAFLTLADTASVTVMKNLKLEGKAQETAMCLECHVTNAAMKDDGVYCESCHGAGSDYSSMKVMKDHAAAVAAGLTEKPKEGCVKCHNDKNPTQKSPFNFDEMWPKIAHSKKAVEVKEK